MQGDCISLGEKLGYSWVGFDAEQQQSANIRIFDHVTQVNSPAHDSFVLAASLFDTYLFNWSNLSTNLHEFVLIFLKNLRELAANLEKFAQMGVD